VDFRWDLLRPLITAPYVPALGPVSREHCAARGQVTWFLPPVSAPTPGAACTRVYMRAFGTGRSVPVPGPGVIPLDEVPGPARATFGTFAEKMRSDGFVLLPHPLGSCMGMYVPVDGQ
jgi:hypothetical protein